jgi:hypothetical protein
LPLPGQALHTLRLPWIFSDRPEITADFNFSPAPAGRTKVELSLGGRFAKFGLPRGAARAPQLAIHCEFISPGELVGRVTHVDGRADLAEVLVGYGAPFARQAFSASSPYVFKTEFLATLAPGDYNVVVAIEDKELSIFSRRTLHVIVPALSSGLGDLKFCLGVGEALDPSGKPARILDPNPWRQVGGASHWGLIVAYDLYGPAPAPGSLRRHSIWRLRGDNDEPLWSEEAPLPPKKRGQLYLAQPPAKALAVLERGIYVFKVEIWHPGWPEAIQSASKTFEVLP